MFRAFARWLAGWPAYRWVGLMAVAYFALALSGTWVNYIELHIAVRQNDIIDLSINQQALASLNHGSRPYPLFESLDCEESGRCSFLLVHPVFFAYLVAVPYALWPSAFTLFAIEDAALAVAALPLFFISRILTRSVRLSLLVAAVYLAWWPAFSAIFSFHWEAFVPLELFLVVWLWLTQRYWLAAPVVLLAYVTLEVNTVLIFLIAAFFLVDWAWLVVRYLAAEVSRLVLARGSAAAGMAMTLAQVRRKLLKPRLVRASLALAAASVVAYVILHEFVATGGGGLLGLPASPSKYALPITQPAHDAVFTWQNLVSAWQSKLLYWAVIFGTLAMVPLLAPRTLILTVPWVLYSVLASPGYYQMGNHYAFISAGVLFIGFAYGVAQLNRWTEVRYRGGPNRGTIGGTGTGPAETPYDVAPPSSIPSTSPSPAGTGKVSPAGEATGTSASDGTGRTGPSDATGASSPSGLEPAASTSDSSAGRDTSLRRRRRFGAALAAALVVVLAFNMFMNPLNPASAGLAADLQQSFYGEGDLALGGGVNATAYHQIEQLVSIIGNEATVAVAPKLYSFIANDPYSYPLSGGMNLSRLPFNTSNGTQFVLYLPHGGPLPSFLAQAIYEPSLFGIRAWIPSSYLGAIWLLERGYTGPTQVLGPPFVGTQGTFTTNNGLKPGGSGKIAHNATGLTGKIVVTDSAGPGSNKTRVGTVFSGPSIPLAEGTYQVIANLSGMPVPGGGAGLSNASVASIQLGGAPAGINQDVLTSTNLTLSWFGNGGWTTLDLNLTVSCPLIGMTVTGINLSDEFDLQMNWVSISLTS